MAAQVKVGQFTARSGTGSQAITGIGFQPKALIVWGQLLAGAAIAGFEWSNSGFADSAINQAGSSATENDTPSTPSDVNSAGNTQLLYGISFLGSPEMVATLTSMDADGFTLTWNTNSFAGSGYNYLAIGGSGVSAAVRSFTGPSGSSLPVQAVTGIGFQPDVLFGFSTQGFGGNDARQSFGWCDGTRQAVSLTNAKNGQSPSKTRRLQRTDAMFAAIDSTSDAITGLASVTSFDSDGFTLNWAVQPGVGSTIYVLAIKGVSAHAGTLTQPTATGTQAVSGVGFAPSAVLLQTVGAAAATGLQTVLSLTRGAMDASTQVSAWCGSENGVSPVSSSRVVSVTRALQIYTPRATLSAEATRSSLDSDGFTLNWSTVDATARQVLYLGLAAAAAPSLTSISPNSGPTLGGTPVTIRGTHLTGVTSVTIGGLNATSVVVVNDTTITAVTPAHAAGATTVTATSPSGSGSLINAYTFIAPPTIDHIDVATGCYTGGTAFVLTGSNYAGTPLVTFDGVAATVTAVTGSTISGTTPPGLGGTVDIVVTNPDGQSATLADAFTYTCTCNGATNATMLIYGALRLCVEGLARAGRTASPEQLTDGLARLNDMLATWALESLTIFTLPRTVVSLLAGVASYTIGDGGDIDITRPDFIIAARLILDVHAVPQTEVETAIFQDQDWELIQQKSLTNPLPQGVYFDHGWSSGLGRIYVWPIPTIGTRQLVLYTLQALEAFADLTRCYTFPPGYAELLRYELALRLAPECGGLKDPLTRILARNAMARVKRMNNRPVQAMLDRSTPGVGSGGPTDANG